MTQDIEQLGRLIAALPPAPEGWVRAAQELPEARRGLDDLIVRAEADAHLRARLLADLESTLSEAGIEPTRRIVADARARLLSS
ncbi:MAG TPA: hypothetical protein VFI04_06675 [Gaiellaceae bacterium]|jgi:hypothetical protein|nr:hypothetical protein [Gaiellaceae bacterium]